MKLFYFLKISLYRFFCTSVGRFLLKILSPFVYVKNLRRQDKKNKPAFLIAVTVDTESGYVDDNEFRVWQYQKPNAFIGFFKGVGNL